MATSTYKTFLMVGSTSGSPASTTYSKLVDIISFPDMGGAPERIDVTTLSDKMRHYVNGVQDVGDNMDFVANYDKTDYTTVKGHEGSKKKYSVWFGGTESSGTVTPTGSEGKFDFEAELSVYVNGGGVNDPRHMTISMALQSDIVAS